MHHLHGIAIALLTMCWVPVAGAQISWLSWEEAMAKQEQAPRKILVDVYTDWCGWCEEMDRRTFGDPAVAAEVDASFYAVKLDAEHPGELSFDGRAFRLETGSARPTHALARELLGGRLGYPTVVFLAEDSEVIQAVPGFHDAADFLKIVRYFGRDHYREMAWGEYVGE